MTSIKTPKLSMRLLLTLITAIALVLGMSVAVNTSKATAAELQPTSLEVSFTDPNGNTPTTIYKSTPYTFGMEFTLPDGAAPGDTLTVNLPQGFTAQPISNVDMGQGSTATVNGNTVVITLGSGLEGQINIAGALNIIATFTDLPEDGAAVDRTVTVGSESVYIPEIKYGAGPGELPMVINKWSGYSTAGTQRKELKLDSNAYNYAWIKPADGQAFAHWFVELNDYQALKDVQDLGDNIVVTDSIDSVPGFTPEVVRNDNGETVNGVLAGSFLLPIFNVYVREVKGDVQAVDAEGNLVFDENNNPVWESWKPVAAPVNYGGINRVATSDFFEITPNADNGYIFTFRLSEYLDSVGFVPSSEPGVETQYAMDYFTLVPERSAQIDNTASMTSDNIPESESEVGWFRYVDASGWVRGEQPLVNLDLAKRWTGVSETSPKVPVTFELLADGEPAADINGFVLEDQTVTLQPGQTTYSWTGLPSQAEKGVPITYSVKENPVDGFTTNYDSAEFTPDLDIVQNPYTFEFLVENVADTPVTTEPTTEPTTTEPTTEPTTTEPTTEPTEPITEPEPKPDPFGDGEGSSARCFANAATSPVWLLIPVAVVAGVASQVNLPHVDTIFGKYVNQLGNQFGAQFNFQDEINRVTGGLGVTGQDPFREQRGQIQALANQFNSLAGQAGRGIPGVDVQMLGTVLGILLAVGGTAGLLAYWCTTPEGQTVGAQASSRIQGKEPVAANPE